MKDSFFNFSFEHWPVALLGMIPAFINLAIFFYVLFFIRKSESSTVFLLFLVTLIMWRMEEVVLQICITRESAKMWYQMFSICTNFLGATGLHFVLTLIDVEKKWKKNYYLLALYMPTLLFSMFFASGAEYMTFDHTETWGWVSVPTHPISMAAFLLIGVYTSIMITLLALYTWRLRHTGSSQYKRLFIILIGSSIPVILGCIYQILLPIFFSYTPIPIASSATIFFSLAILIAITKYNLLEYSPGHQWENIIEHMNEGILIVDNNHIIQYVNNKFCEMLGYSRRELLNRSASDTFALPSGKSVINKMVERRKKLFRDRYELMMRKKDGSHIICEINAQPYLDHDNKVVGSIGIHTDITERQRSERALRESESKLREAQSVASVGSWEMDAKTRLTKWSDEKYKILGLEPQKDIPSLPLLLSFIHPEDLERIRESFEQLFFSPRNTSFNYRIVRTDGTIRYLFSNSKCVFDTQRALVRLHGITQDITETRLAEQKIEFEHRNQEALINNTKDLMWSVDKDLKLITCNEAFNQVVKYLSGNSINKGDPVLSKGFSEKQLIRWNELYKRALSGESFTQIEYNDSPYERWSEISFSPIRKEDQIIGTACYSRDITERQKAQEDLKTLTERHTLATASAKIGIWDYDNVNNILVWDEKMYEIFDVPKDKFSGAYEAWSRTVHPEDISIAAAELQDAINGVKDFHTVFRIIWPNEELRYIEAHAFALKNREGKTIRMIGVNWDITERKKTEQDLLEKVGEMDAFIYRASHDLRGPLASIAGLTNLGREEIKDKKSIFYLDKIHDSVTRLDNILQELSKIARVTQAKIEPTEINLKKEIDDILDSLKHLPNYAQIGFIKEINVPVLFSDKILLIIILQNLIINSINYYDEKKEKPFLHIKTFENINGIKIILSDNGVGIPADMQEKVFEMFFRGTNTSKGSGLGLYIVKNAIKKLNGTIHLASNEGEGTTFSINLPKGT